MTADVRVVVVDDHPIVRNALVALLGSVPGFAVVGTGGTGAEAVREVVLHRPDVALLDLTMPGRDGFSAIREIARVAPEAAVLVLTMHDDAAAVFAAMRAGARGYLVKGAEQDEILDAIRAVARGEVVFGPGVAAHALSSFTTTSPAGPRPFPSLTDREHQILDLLAAGHTNAVIGERLHLARKTVANQLSAIFAKLQVDGRGEAIVIARDAGLGREGGAAP